MTEITRLGLIALSIFAASGLLADIAIIIVLAERVESTARQKEALKKAYKHKS
jgi:hypothetical protein